MPISVECPECFKEYRLKEAAAGRQFKCKECGAPVSVPSAEQTTADDDFLGSLDEAVQMGAGAKGHSSGELPRLSPTSGRTKSKKAGGEKKSKRRKSRDGLAKVANGLNIVLFALAAKIALNLLSPAVGMLPTNIAVNAGLFLKWCGLAASGLSFGGECLCLAAPKRSRTQVFLVLTLAAEVGSILFLANGLRSAASHDMAGMLQALGSLLMSGILALLSPLFFLLFLKRLSQFVKYAQGEDDANEILALLGIEVAIPFGRILGPIIPGLIHVVPYVVVLGVIIVGIAILLKYIDLVSGLSAHIRSTKT